jgi:hypothetical protein
LYTDTINEKINIQLCTNKRLFWMHVKKEVV